MEGLCRGVKFEAWKVRFLREQEPEVPCTITREVLIPVTALTYPEERGITDA